MPHSVLGGLEASLELEGLTRHWVRVAPTHQLERVALRPVGTGKSDASVGTGRTNASLGTGKVEASLGTELMPPWTGRTDASLGTGRTDARSVQAKSKHPGYWPNPMPSTGRTDASLVRMHGSDCFCTGKVKASLGTGRTDASSGRVVLMHRWVRDVLTHARYRQSQSIPVPAELMPPRDGSY